MEGFDCFRPDICNIPPLPLIEIRVIEVGTTAPSVWPHPQAPEPDFRARGMTEARCVYTYHYGRTSDERLDALQHLASICMMKSRSSGKARAFFDPRPRLKFVGAKTSWDDWENSAPYNVTFQKKATRGWFVTALPDFIDKYGPRHVTNSELLELARMRDGNLLHVCNALVNDLQNEGKTDALHEISTSRMWERNGQEFYFDTKRETAIQPTCSLTLSEHEAPDYASAAALLVSDKKLRAALPKRVRETLELVFRMLDGGTPGEDIICSVASSLNRDERTIRRHLQKAREIASDLTTASGKVMQALARIVIPDDRAAAHATCARPSDCALPEISETANA